MGPKDHIWDPKTIYEIQRSGTGKLDPKTIEFNTVWTGKLDPKTIYGAQRPYMGPKDHIWDSTQLGQGKWTKDHRIQHSWDRETGPKDHIWDSMQWDRETGPKDHRIQHSLDKETAKVAEER